MELVQCAFAATDIKFTVQLVNIRNKKPALLYSAAASGRGIIPKYKLSSLELISLLLPHHRPLMPPFINGLEAEGLLYGRSLIRWASCRTGLKFTRLEVSTRGILDF